MLVCTNEFIEESIPSTGCFRIQVPFPRVSILGGMSLILVSLLIRTHEDQPDRG